MLTAEAEVTVISQNLPEPPVTTNDYSVATLPAVSGPIHMVPLMSSIQLQLDQNVVYFQAEMGNKQLFVAKLLRVLTEGMSEFLCDTCIASKFLAAATAYRSIQSVSHILRIIILWSTTTKIEEE